MNSGSLEGKSILITGACGFIGSHLTDSIISCQKPKKIILADNLSTGSLGNLGNNIDNQIVVFKEGDVSNYEFCETIVQGVDIIIHQAALGSVPRSLENPIASHLSNSTGFLNLLFAASQAKVQKFIYASSSSVYGDELILPKKENKIGLPLSPYAVTKLTNELYAHVFNSHDHMKIVGLRYFNVFGPRQEADSGYAAVIPKFIAKMIKGEDVIIYGNGQQKRDFTYVSNVVNANLKLACMDIAAISGQVFNIAASNPVTVLEVFNHLARKLNYNRPPVFQDRRKGDIENSFADISKASVSFGFVPELNLEKGLDLTIDWFKNR